MWKFAEGSCVLARLTFNGNDAQGHPKWDGFANVSVLQFETASSLTKIVGSFNISTNIWAKTYMFKRLRFLGSKTLSSLFTLTYLSLARLPYRLRLCLWSRVHLHVCRARRSSFRERVLPPANNERREDTADRGIPAAPSLGKVALCIRRLHSFTYGVFKRPRCTSLFDLA